jgi:PleD family two-component response regulator
VEDSSTQAARFAKVMAEDGLEVVRAATAEIALKVPENDRPDLIVLDTIFPA